MTRPDTPGSTRLRPTDLLLLPGAVVVWGLAVLGALVGTAAAVAAAAVLIALALTVTTVLGTSRTAPAVLAHLGIVVLAGALLFPALQRLETAQETLTVAADDAAVVQLALTAAQDPAPPTSGPPWAREGLQMRARSRAGAARIGTTTRTLPSSVPILVRADGDAAEDLAAVRDGDALLVRGTVRVSGSLIVLRAADVQPVPAGGIVGRAQSMRQQLREQARHATAALPPEEAALIRGMTTGDTQGMSEQTEEIMRRAGISHLVAVSGANIALVLAAVLGPALLLGLRRRPRLLLAAVTVGAYVWLVGDEPSVQRAATMAAPLLAARYAGVRASPVAALALTVALWAVIDPVTAASVGFLLSALSTAAILLAAPPLATALVSMSGRRLGRTGALILAVPIVAQLACTPLLILLTPEVSAWAVPVNLLVGPIVGPSTVIGLLALCLGVIWPPGAQLLYGVAGGGAHLVLLIARAADALPGSRIPVPEGAAGALLALAAIIIAGILLAGRRNAAVRWIAAAAAVALLAPGLARHLPGGAPQDWAVAACAVGQGDALLLRGEGEQAPTVLVDTGPDPVALRECLDRLQIQRIDLLVLTHPHADHTGGRDALAGTRIPREQWTCPLPEAGRDNLSAVPAQPVVTGEAWQRPGLTIEVLWPPSAEAAHQASRAETGSGEGDAANDCSVVIAATWPSGGRLIALGDLEPVAQRLLAQQDIGTAQLVKVAHHGSRRQHAELYTRIDPEFALITVGEDNRFGHPTAEALSMLEHSGAQILRTDQHGTVILPVGPDPEPRSVGPAR